MKSPSFNPLIGYHYRAPNSFGMLSEFRDKNIFEATKLSFEAKRKNAKTDNERILYEKKISDIELGIVDAINIRNTGKFYPRPWGPVSISFFKQCSPKYGAHYRAFYTEITKEADYSLGRKNANLYLLHNELGFKILMGLKYINNYPTELEMLLHGYLRKPEYKEQYSVLIEKMDNIRNELAVRKKTPELIADIKKRVAEYTRQAKVLNEDKSYLLSVEERFKAHYAPCGPGIAELAIAELYKDTGSEPIVFDTKKSEKHVSNSAGYRRNMITA
jgi:hypothetical protein